MGFRFALPILQTLYSITACSGAADCARRTALVEPIMMVSGIAQAVKIITIW